MAAAPRNIILAAPQITLAALKLDWTAFANTRFLGTLATPIHTRRLWNFIAVAIGAMDAETLDHRSTAKATYATPPEAVARENNAKVLVAEDNTTNRTVITHMLGRQGVAHDIADNGKIALEMLTAENYALLLSDLHMPVMDGFQLTRARRKLEARAQLRRVPIVAITSDVLPETAQHCQAVGMDGHLRKPIEVERLEEVLRKHVPAAFAIRSVREDGPIETAAGPSGAAAEVISLNPWLDAVQSIDLDIFNPNALIDIFGDFEAEAADVVSNYVKTLPSIVRKIDMAFSSGNYRQAEFSAHELKGASLSTGATRLGRLAMDIENALKNNDLEAAKSFHIDLDQTVEALTHALSGVMTLTEHPMKTH